ncbi:MAG: type II secretion system protein [Nitrospira sp.]|nr:type II secretion system protein [Nitrospira sp.]
MMKDENGFTLLEIMISLAVIGGLLVTLLYTLNYHLSIAEKHEKVTVASLLAKAKMSEIEKNPAVTKGEFPEPYSGYRYVTGTKESPFPGFSVIYVVVSNGKEEVKLAELIQSPKSK